MGSSPGWSYTYVPTTAQWNAAFASKQDDLGFTPVNRAGDTMAGRLRTAASQASSTGFSIYPGTDPTSPNNGDVWITSTGLYARVNNVTIGPISDTIGTVTSVGLSAPEFLTVTNSPVTSSGVLTLSLASQTQNKMFASPNGSSGAPTFRALVGGDLPNPTTSTLGGVQAITAVASNWIRSISTSGVPALSQPAFTDISGSIAAGQVPSNIITNAMLSQVTAPVFKGRSTVGTGAVQDMTPTTATSLLDAVVGDSGSGGTKGLVPAPAAGDAAAGKFLKANGTWAAPPTGLTSGTVTTLSGTSTDLTGIPATAKQITLVIENLSLSGSAFPLLQIGDSGGPETSGYVSSSVANANPNIVTGATSTAGFIIQSGAPANQISGSVTFSLLDASTNRWTATSLLCVGSSATVISGAGTKALSATLDRIRLTTNNGTDTFDGGTVAILYQ